MSSKLQELLCDRRRLIESTIQIQTKKRGVMPLRFNRMQTDYFPKRSSNDVFAKARQLGASTMVTAEFLTDAVTIKGLNVLMIWQSEKAALDHMDLILRPMFEALPDYLRVDDEEIEYRPTLGQDNRFTMSFPRMRSSITVAPAGSIKVGRGKPIHRAHFSECAFYPPGTFESLRAAVEGSAPTGYINTDYGYKALASRIVWESTSNGRDGNWYDLVKDTQNLRNSYRLHFYPWMYDIEARSGVDDPESLPADRHSPLDYSSEELTLIQTTRAQYGIELHEDNIRWRRWKKAQQGDLFPQEIAETLEGSFLVRAGMVFNRETLEGLEQEASRIPIRRIEDNGLVRIWQEPLPGERYVLAADPSEGLWDNPKAAYSAACVIKASNREHVASVYGKIPPTQFADKIADLGLRYNKALVVPEINNTCGGEVIKELMAIKNYPNVYRQFDPATRMRGNHGWRTHRGNRWGMIQSAKKIIESGGLHTYDKVLVGQLYDILDIGGDIDNAPGRFMDLAMCVFIALSVLTEYPQQTAANKVSFSRRY